MITLSNRKTYLLGIAFLALPLLIWCFGWLSLPCAIITAIALVVGVFLIWKKMDQQAFCSGDVVVSIPLVVAIAIALLLWCVLGGQGGFLYQSSDWNARNAVFRDLISYDWPVVYENGNALCYYFGFWLVPALVGKLFLAFGFGVDAVWVGANIALLVWSACGVFLAIVLLLQCVKKSSPKIVVGVVALFIFFSGMDIVGLLLTGDMSAIETRLTQKVHIEWWAEVYQLSSFTTQLFWVFNQAIPAWIATLLILSTTRLGNDIFIGVLSAFLCPLPTMGLLFIGFAKLVGRAKARGVLFSLRELASLQTLIALIPLISIGMFLTLSQRATLTSATFGGSQILFHAYIGGVTLPHILRLGLFFLLEYGLLLLLLLPTERKNPYWYGALVLLMVANITRLGPSSDFAMRASIPGLMVLLVMVAKHLSEKDFRSYYQWLREMKGKPVDSMVAQTHGKIVRVILVICLTIGVVTPVVEMVRGPVKMIEAQQIPMPCDEVKTLSEGLDANFVTPDYEATAFARMIGR